MDGLLKSSGARQDENYNFLYIDEYLENLNGKDELWDSKLYRNVSFCVIILATLFKYLVPGYSFKYTS